MNRLLTSIGLVGAAIVLCGCGSMNAKVEVTAPVATKIPHEMTLHGVTRVDNYYWLRDDSRTAPQVLDYLHQENAYTQAQLAPYKPLENQLFKELTSRVEPNESTVPYHWHNHWYSRRYSEGKEYPIIVRSQTQSGAVQSLLDANERAAGHDFYRLAAVNVSPDEKLLAFAEDTLSRRIYTVYFKDLSGGQLLSDKLTDVDGGVVWSNDNRYVFYIAKDPQTLLGDRVFRHKLGTQQSADVLVYHEKDDSYFLDLGKSLDETEIVLTHENTITSEVSLLDANAPLGEFLPVLPREEGIEYSVAKRGNELYILTNWQAQNFQLMKVNINKAANKDNWQPVIPHDPDVLLEDFLLLDDFLVLQTREQGLSHIRIYPDADTTRGYELQFDDPAYVVGLDVNPNQHSRELRVYYSSPSTPESIYDYQLDFPGRRTLLKQEKVLGGFNAANYRTERLRITARDGTPVPVTLVYRKDKFQRDGTNPLYIYGYGAYGIVMEPAFQDDIISLLDRGIVYAIAHVRGSDMLGRRWYEEGKMLHKQNSFNDFVDVTKGLLNEKYGAPGKVLAAGGSAGGLLMGGVINQAPELYLAVAAHVPFVDIVTTMLDESIPLTTNEYDEWGNPQQKKYFDYMLSYSPYDNVQHQAYPNLLVTSGLYDSQVQYFEPAKWVAKLRDYKTDNHLLLLHMDMTAGHGGKSGRYSSYEDTALEYAFFLGLLGYK
ncbi:S9 family peptidase [Shewanella sp. A32]|uniref:S9 family peptidase n=1 Tax=Shewanella sp. A32 TaxID=3031327 RepID=UPI0023B8D647|nr:S9 family peptidase [Shewanella sp. A32]MDF0534595.1 S9 family peptidase [Shewanella sp. A32]